MSRLNLWRPEPKRKAGMVRPPVVPGLELSRYNHGELATRLRRRENATKAEPGVAWARVGIREEKQRIHAELLALLDAAAFRKLSILTFPGMHWTFERALLKSRERDRHLDYGGVQCTTIVGLEREEAIYRSAVANIPRGKSGSASRIQVRTTPSYATAAVRTRQIHRFFRASFEDYALQESGELGQGCRWFNAAWLDFNGHIGPRRLEAIERFWTRQLRDLLIITLMNGRTHPEVTELLGLHGSIEGMLVARLSGSRCEQAKYYGDSAPMVQIVLRRTTGEPTVLAETMHRVTPWSEY